MKKIVYLIVAIFICSVNAFAQGSAQVDTMKYIKENYDKQKVIDRYADTIKVKKMTISKLETKVKELQSKLDAEKFSNKSQQLGNLKDSINALNKKIADLQKMNKSLLDSLNKEVSNKATELAQKLQVEKDKNEKLEAELRALYIFKVHFLESLADSVDSKWMNKTYVQIKSDVNKLQEDLKKYDEFANSNTKVKIARDKLKTLLDEYKLYDEVVKCLDSKYDKNNVTRLIAQIKALPTPTNRANANEMSAVRKLLGDYKFTVTIFQTVINKIDKRLENKTDKNSAFEVVKVVLEREETENGNITAIKNIPWMKKQFEEYYKELEKNCLVKGNVHNLILGLET